MRGELKHHAGKWKIGASIPGSDKTLVLFGCFEVEIAYPTTAPRSGRAHCLQSCETAPALERPSSLEAAHKFLRLVYEEGT